MFFMVCLFLSGAWIATDANVRVLDVKAVNKALYVQEFCNIPSCPDGQHTVCLYNPVVLGEAGPGCTLKNFQIKLTAEAAFKFVDAVNIMRSKLATGMEELAQNYTPTAYGMMKLSWDNELATIAQLWADQCITDNDVCRSTWKHPKVDQITYFESYAPQTKFYNEIYNVEHSKVVSWILEDLKTMYEDKRLITKKVVMGIDNLNRREELYLKLMMSKATRIGCGYAVYNTNRLRDLSEILMREEPMSRFWIPAVIATICNINYIRQSSEPFINTTKPVPGDITRSIKCGCPTGTLEEIDTCLCQEMGGIAHRMALLPIITVEDPPSSKLPGKKLPDLTYNQYNEPEDFFPNNHKRMFGDQHKPAFLSNENLRSSFEVPQKNKKPFKNDWEPRKTLDALARLQNYVVNRRNGLYLVNKQNASSQTNLQIPNNNKKYFTITLQIEKVPLSDFNASTGMDTYNRYVAMGDDNRENGKLMELLDSLEREVNHIEIAVKAKDAINTKIDKIHDHLKKNRQPHGMTQKDIHINRYDASKNTIRIESRDNHQFDHTLYDTRLILRPNEDVSTNNDDRNFNKIPRNQNQNSEEMNAIRRKYMQKKLDLLEKEVNDAVHTLHEQTLQHSDELRNYK